MSATSLQVYNRRIGANLPMPDGISKGLLLTTGFCFRCTQLREQPIEEEGSAFGSMAVGSYFCCWWCGMGWLLPCALLLTTFVFMGNYVIFWHKYVFKVKVVLGNAHFKNWKLNKRVIKLVVLFVVAVFRFCFLFSCSFVNIMLFVFGYFIEDVALSLTDTLQIIANL